MASQTFNYFAYGSNMLSRRLRERTPSAAIFGNGFIDGYKLAFDKVSIDGSGKCNIQATGMPGDRVYGVLFIISETESRSLDKAEGLGSGYGKCEVQVTRPGGSITAVTYIADRTDSQLRPYHWYKEFVLRGAIEHKLPAAYIRRLQTTDAQTDPDEKRRAKNEALLAGV